MISYNKTWLANLHLQEQLKKDLNHARITQAEFKAIVEKYPVEFYTPNIFARIGLFILTFIIVAFTDSLLTLMASSSDIFENSGWYFFLGALTYIALECIINIKNHYRSGVDDALLYITAGQFAVAFYVMLFRNQEPSGIIIAGIVFIISLYLTLRFADMLMSAVCCISLFAIIYFGWTAALASGLITLPFVMIIASAAVYWFAKLLVVKTDYINYQNCLKVVQLVGLIVLYAGGNYYIIQTLSVEISNKPGPVPFGMFFWVWTILIPFIYIGSGIKKKDSILLRTGLLLVTAAAVTFRNYYHILPVDIALTMVGLIVQAIVYGVMKYLKTPKHGFTYADQEEANLMDQLKVESLLIAETFSHAPSAPVNNDGVKFGGGDFGGGGSSSSF